MANGFEDNVLQIADYDLNDTLKKQVNALSSRSKTAIDLGCGIGSLLPLLTDKYKNIYAIDAAEELLNVAKSKYTFNNVEYLCHDLSGNIKPPVVADVTFCINVLISASREQRSAILKTVSRATNKNGISVIVVPSLESEIYQYQALLRQKEKNKIKAKNAINAINKLFSSEVASPVEGIIDIGGALTKCYLKEELTLFVQQAGFVVEDIDKVEYAWDEVMDNPPGWLQQPCPWDWLVVARKE